MLALSDGEAELRRVRRPVRRQRACLELPVPGVGLREQWYATAHRPAVAHADRQAVGDLIPVVQPGSEPVHRGGHPRAGAEVGDRPEDTLLGVADTLVDL